MNPEINEENSKDYFSNKSMIEILRSFEGFREEEHLDNLKLRIGAEEKINDEIAEYT